MVETFWTWLSSHFNFLVLFGFFGQGLFMMRFIAQWLYSEKLKRSAVPDVFWYFSLGGGIVTLIYAVLKNDIVFMLAQFLGLFIYIRNIVIIWKHRLNHHNVDDEKTLAALSAKTAALLTEIQNGKNLSETERRQALEALRLLDEVK